MTLTNAEKQARYRERRLGVDGGKGRIGLNLNAGIRAKIGRLARCCGYTITVLVEELVERAEWRGGQGCRPARSRPITTANDPCHRWHGYEKFADVPDLEPDPDDTQAIAKCAAKLLLRALLDDGVMQRTMMLFAVSVSRLLPDFSFAVATNRVAE